MIPKRAALAAIVLVALTACPKETPPGASPTSQAPPAVEGGTVRVLLTDDVDSLDPQHMGNPSSYGIARTLYRGLMAFPPAAGEAGAMPVPDLAAAPPDVSTDRITYTFHLRAGVAFGPPASRAITADDVKGSLGRIFAAGSPLASYYRVIAGVTAPDPETVVIRLVRPTNDLLWLLALPPASVVPVGLPAFPQAAEISPSGPYRLAASDGYQPERGIHLVRNQAWMKASDPVRKAWVDEIRVTIGLAPEAIRQRIARGDADLSGSELPPLPAASASAPATGSPPGSPSAPSSPSSAGPPVVRAPNGCVRYLFMNTRVAPFSSQRVRAAVSMALNRGAITATYGLAATPADAILPPSVDGFDPARPVPSADARSAKAKLKGAGYAKGFTTTLVVGDQPADRAQAAFVRSGLARAGVHVRVQVVPIALLYEDHYERPAAATPMGIATWCADWPGLGGRGALQPLVDGRSLGARGNTDYAFFNNASVDRRMDVASAAEGAAAASAWANADSLATSLAAVVPLAYLQEESSLGARIMGFVPHPFFTHGDLTALWLKPA